MKYSKVKNSKKNHKKTSTTNDRKASQQKKKRIQFISIFSVLDKTLIQVLCYYLMLVECHRLYSLWLDNCMIFALYTSEFHQIMSIGLFSIFRVFMVHIQHSSQTKVNHNAHIFHSFIKLVNHQWIMIGARMFVEFRLILLNDKINGINKLSFVSIFLCNI